MPQILKRSIVILSLFALVAILVRCEPASFTSPVSPLTNPTLSSTEIAIRRMLATKTARTREENLTEVAPRLTPYSPTTKLFKPTPANLPTIAPLATAFPPLAGSSFVGKPVVPAGAGFITHGLRPYYVADGFQSENMWIEDNDTRTLRTFVSAGYLAAPGGFVTQQGAIDVRMLNPAYALVYVKQVLTPIQAGSLHIVDVVGERLILRSTNGTTFYFDVPTRQFVSSLDAVVPTFTPSPKSPLPTPIGPIATLQ
jgi:hypothetical protein